MTEIIGSQKGFPAIGIPAVNATDWEPTRLTALMTVDPPATYGNGVRMTASEVIKNRLPLETLAPLYNIKIPTQGGPIWITHVGDNSTLHEHAKGTMRSLAASNVKADAGAWPKAEAEEYLKEARKMWICATMRRAG